MELGREVLGRLKLEPVKAREEEENESTRLHDSEIEGAKESHGEAG
jgi:hypothetical protein